jgi:hypothetical protein
LLLLGHTFSKNGALLTFTGSIMLRDMDDSAGRRQPTYTYGVVDGTLSNHHGAPAMKKTLAAIATGAMLIAGQALASNQASAAPSVVDRVGASVGSSDEFGGGVSPGLIFIAVTVLAFAAITAADDDSESD